MEKLLSKTKELIIDILLPKRCLNCNKEGSYICDSCSLFLSEAPATKSVYGLEELVSVWEYEGLIKKALTEVKKNKTFDILNELINKAFLRRETNLPDNSFITFVPLWKAKEKEMGFNQAELIARRLGEKTGKKAVSLLKKNREGLVQDNLGKKERLNNVKNSFSFSGSFVPEKVVLVDDYLVSGATVAECCRVLKEAGVKLVWGFTLAKIV